MKGLKPLQFAPLGKGVVERSKAVDPWLKLCWGDSLTLLETLDWFERIIFFCNIIQQQ